MNDVTKDLLEALRFLLSAHGEQLDLAFAQAHDAIARAEAALAEPQPDADGWIPWAGGECPVSAKTVVQVKDRLGRSCLGAAWLSDWEHDGSFGDIIAYRIVRK